MDKARDVAGKLKTEAPRPKPAGRFSAKRALQRALTAPVLD